jgi:hypothetical protein
MNTERSNQLTVVAGVHYVAAHLAYLGFHAVPTTRNVAGPDVLVTNLTGSKAISLQVKTTIWALRTRGRGEDKQPHHYEWDIGWGSAKLNHPHVLFALVDLKEFRQLPDVFHIPSKVIFEYFEGGDPKTWRRARYHEDVRKIEQCKNSWDLLAKALDGEM